MKKYIAIPLLFLYLFAVSGTLVQIHYCGSEISSVSVNDQSQDCCCAASKAHTAQGYASFGKPAGECCKDKVFSVKIGQDQNRANDVQLQLQSLQLVVPPALTVGHTVATLPPVTGRPAYLANAPPGRWQNIPLYKLHSRFTYYG